MKNEIIYTEQYALIVSDEEIKEGYYFYSVRGLIEKAIINYSKNEHNGVIIAHRPLKDAPILEGVPLLPEFEDDDFLNTEIQVVGDNKTMSVSNFLKKYGKETYKYTEEDLRKVIEASRDIRYVTYSEDELIQSLQTKRPKYFECEIARITKFNGEPDYFELNSKPNSQGQTELVGEYIF